MRTRNDGDAVIAAERRRQIHNLILRDGSVNATELASYLGVGLSTVRRDLDVLDSEGKISRVHGGAVLKESAQPRIPYQEARGSNLTQKAQIAEAALKFLPRTGAVFIGGGTTAYQLAIRLPEGRDISVVTNGLDVAAHIASRNIAPVDFVGGTIRPESLQSNCEEAIESIYWDVTFIGAAAVDIARGLTTDNRYAARLERTILRHGSKFVMLCDSSKIGRFAYAHVAPVDLIDVFVTDAGADPDFLKELEDHGVEVVVAGGWAAPWARSAPPPDSGVGMKR